MGTPLDHKFAKRAALGAFVMFAGSALASCSGGGGGGGSAVSPIAPSTPPNTGGTPTGGSGGGTTTPPQSTLKVVEYPLPSSIATSAAAGITAGPDGNLWFGEGIHPKVGKISINGAITEYPVGPALPNGTLPTPALIVSSPDGSLYAAAGPAVYKIRTDGSAVAIPGFSNRSTFGLAIGPDKNVWITDPGTTQIVVANSNGVITSYNVPIAPTTTTFDADLAEITAGPDGALWFTEPNANSIGRVTVSGSFSQYSLPTAAARPYGITAGPDGNVWFTESNHPNGGLGYVTPQGQVREIVTSRSSFGEIVTGPDGNLWATSGSTNEIARITPSGAISYTSVTSRNAGDPGSVTIGPDQNVWFVEQNANLIGKIQLH